MGAILQGRDTDLGRDIAVKVLLEAHRGKPELVQRFVEEAQISGQLQHPGIAPVYELGHFADQRPYFTMKLVKGKTLATLLAARQAPLGERPKFIGIFAQICQTLAYAHARSVIHRDLKPANVMDGAFGEVQVMDWGLAKVLAEGGIADEQKAQRRADVSIIRTQRSAGSDPSNGSGSHTQAGSLLGTPAYVAPEQARGEVELVDERSDVFGLGAILCEILTGLPPFTGTGAEAARKAQKGKVEDAYTRLDACLADEELIGLAKRCLAAEPWDRPAHAGQVAQEFIAYQQSVDERLRQAEQERAAQAARAEEEAKRRVLSDQLAVAAGARASAETQKRRVTVGLAAALLILVLIGGAGAGWWWQQQTTLTRDVEKALAQAKAHQAVGRWPDARIALERAEGRLGNTESNALRANVQQARNDVDMVMELDEIRMRQSGAYTQEGKFDLTGADRPYAELFAKYGIDVGRLGSANVAEQVRASAVRETLLAGMNNWMRLAPTAQRAGLQAVADAADDNAWRTASRAALLAGDLKKIQDLAWETEALTQSPSNHVWMSESLNDAGLFEEAVACLQRAQQRYPEDFWINFNLGCRLLWGLRPAKPAEAVSYFRIAVALRPGSALTHSCLGAAFNDLNELAAGIAECRRAIELDPLLAAGHSNLGNALEKQGKLDEAIVEQRKAIALDASMSGPHTNLGVALFKQDKLDEGIAEHRKALERDSNNAHAHANLGAALVNKNRWDEAIAEFHRAINLEPKRAFPHNNLGSVLLRQGKFVEAIPELQQAINLDPKWAIPHINLGAAFQRQGKLVEAIAEYRLAAVLDPKAAEAHYNLGYALHGQGNLNEATTEIRLAISLDPKLALAHNRLGGILFDKGKWEEASAEHQEAIKLDPKIASYHTDLGNALAALNRLKEAIVENRLAITLDPKLASGYNNLAWLLATCADVKLRDPGEAVLLAKKAVELNSKDGNNYNTLGAALWSAREWKAAVEAFQKSMDMRNGRDGNDWFFLAMCHHHLGDKEKARSWYDKAVEWMDKNAASNVELRRFRAEAAQLLEVS